MMFVKFFYFVLCVCEIVAAAEKVTIENGCPRDRTEKKDIAFLIDTELDTRSLNWRHILEFMENVLTDGFHDESNVFLGRFRGRGFSQDFAHGHDRADMASQIAELSQWNDMDWAKELGLRRGIRAVIQAYQKLPKEQREIVVVMDFVSSSELSQFCDDDDIPQLLKETNIGLKFVVMKRKNQSRNDLLKYMGCYDDVTRKNIFAFDNGKHLVKAYTQLTNHLCAYESTAIKKKYECACFGDPHCIGFKMKETQDWMTEGEFLFLDTPGLKVTARFIGTYRIPDVSSVGSIAWGGDDTCGRIFELHMGNPRAGSISRLNGGGHWNPDLSKDGNYDPLLRIRRKGKFQYYQEYVGISAINEAMEDEGAKCDKYDVTVSAKLNTGDIRLQFKDKSVLKVLDFVNPTWGLAFTIVSTEEKLNFDHDDGFCVGKKARVPCCDDNVGFLWEKNQYPVNFFSFYPARHMSTGSCTGLRNTATVESGLDADPTFDNVFPTTRDFLICPEDLLKEAQRLCAGCPDLTRNGCIADGCLSGTVDGVGEAAEVCKEVDELADEDK